jgi:GH15 family glucan-1,4-alpha-glucosidase
VLTESVGRAGEGLAGGSTDVGKSGGTLVSIAAVLAALTAASRAGAVVPHRSEQFLPSSNGRASIAYDAVNLKLAGFLEHPYRYPRAGQETRNFVFDSYPGVRVGVSATWLNAIPAVVVEYVAGTGVVHVRRTYGGLTLDEYHFAPRDLSEYASVMLVQVTRASGAGAIDVYSLFNYHLGSGGPLPGTDNEQIAYDATRDAFSEAGPSAVAFGYTSVAPSSHHGCTPSNPYASLNTGANLADNPGTGGPTNDAVAGLQASLGDMAIGSCAWAGWVTVLAPDANASGAVDRVRAWIAGRTSDRLLADEVAAWTQWVGAPPQGASSHEAALARQAQVTLRMAQVAEPGASTGQVLASLAPGQWNITWVRDMAYAVVALAKSGHFAEAKAALAFQMGATAGGYQQYVGVPYQISVVRYFGDGTEESDTNQNGPNVEFDGFGLFLWSLDEYVRASGDMQSLTTWWPLVSAKVADVLVHLQESNGVIAADSSIWEVHWNGQQKHFAYTTLAAARGLCAAGRLAGLANDAVNAMKYVAAGSKARDAILTQLRAPDGTIGQSVEALAAGTGWLDASELEAINWGLVDATRHTARATLRSITRGLVPPSGRGYMRDDIGAWYDSQEWVFVDLRAARALELTGDAVSSAGAFSWNVDQALENFGELSELHDAVTADYVGASPMVGFGAGAYLIALAERGSPGTPACGAYANEPVEAVDGGAEGGSTDAGTPTVDGSLPGVDGGVDGQANGTTPGGTGSSGGCACVVSRAGDIDDRAFAPLGVVLLAALRRRRRA